MPSCTPWCTGCCAVTKAWRFSSLKSKLFLQLKSKEQATTLQGPVLSPGEPAIAPGNAREDPLPHVITPGPLCINCLQSPGSAVCQILPELGAASPIPSADTPPARLQPPVSGMQLCLRSMSKALSNPGHVAGRQPTAHGVGPGQRFCSGLMTRLPNASLCPDQPCCPFSSTACLPSVQVQLHPLGQVAYSPNLTQCPL